jgi:tetraacyldisaccharide 4'-kinase
MKLSKPAQWALSPFSAIFGGVVLSRAALYRAGLFRSKRLAGTVISVGNLTVGGTGKTPTVLWIAEKLASEGHRPAILTRGYRGASQADAHGIPQSDEVALLRERLGAEVKLGVGKDRYKSGKTLEHHGTRWFILDDGFQHLRLHRDANIVLLDASDPFGGGFLLPAGRLREPRSALKRADVVVVTRTERAPAIEALVRRYTPAPVFYAWTELKAVLRAPALAVEMPSDCCDAKFFAFCGIGNPAAFFNDLRRWDFSVAGAQSFPDHHRYSAADAAQLDRAAAAAGADALICTEKDVFNLRDAMPKSLPVYACRIQLAFSDADGFWRAVLSAIANSARRRPIESAS